MLDPGRHVRLPVLVTQALQGALIVGPAALHLDPEIEHDFLLEHVLHVDPSRASNLLEATALVANDDFLLPLAFYQNQGMDMEYLALRLERLDFRSEEHTSELQSRENLVCR